MFSDRASKASDTNSVTNVAAFLVEEGRAHTGRIESWAGQEGLVTFWTWAVKEKQSMFSARLGSCPGKFIFILPTLRL